MSPRNGNRRSGRQASEFLHVFSTGELRQGHDQSLCPLLKQTPPLICPFLESSYATFPSRDATMISWWSWAFSERTKAHLQGRHLFLLFCWRGPGFWGPRRLPCGLGGTGLPLLQGSHLGIPGGKKRRGRTHWQGHKDPSMFKVLRYSLFNHHLHQSDHVSFAHPAGCSA
jgi:hypothetical protein